MPATELSGDALRALIHQQIALHSNGLVQFLAPFDPVQATTAWHATCRAVDEFINVPMFGFERPQETLAFGRLSLGNDFLADPPKVLGQVVPLLNRKYDAALAQRFAHTMLQCAALGNAYRQSGMADLGYGIHLGTIGDVVTYLQSRRRLMVALLYTLPYACKGTLQVAQLDTMNQFMPRMEHSGMALVSLYRQQLLADIVPDFRLRDDGTTAMGSHHFQPLESFFLEPERLSVQAMAEFRPSQLSPAQEEPLDPKKIFSAAELRNQIRLIARAYTAFGLDETRFSVLAKLIIAFSRHVQDDYFLTLPRSKFDAMVRAQTGCAVELLEADLINPAADFVTNTNSYAPFLAVGGNLVSNVNLLMRFLNAFKNFTLEARKRYQVHSGFVFEDMVKRDLAELGFAVTDIKRINRKEFDVVAIRERVIYNLQCKNSWVDLTQIEANPKAYARYNRYLAGYYGRALAKEIRREQMLRDALGLSDIRHFVISRFPIITEDARIIAYKDLSRLKASSASHS